MRPIRLQFPSKAPKICTHKQHVKPCFLSKYQYLSSSVEYRDLDSYVCTWELHPQIKHQLLGKLQRSWTSSTCIRNSFLDIASKVLASRTMRIKLISLVTLSIQPYEKQAIKAFLTRLKGEANYNQNIPSKKDNLSWLCWSNTLYLG